MMESKDLLDKFTSFWKPVVRTMMSPRANSKIVEVVMLGNIHNADFHLNQGNRPSSSNALIPDWFSFMKTLCELEPILTESGIQLTPRFVHFPYHTQRCMITFLEKHKAELPRGILVKFLKSLQGALTDSWCKLYHHLLHIHVLHTYSNDQQCINRGFISQQSNNYFDKLCRRIKSEDSKRSYSGFQQQCHWMTALSTDEQKHPDWLGPCVMTKSQSRKRNLSSAGELQQVSSTMKRQKAVHAEEDTFPDLKNDISTDSESEAPGEAVLSLSQECVMEEDSMREKLKHIISPLQEFLQSSKPSMTSDQINVFKEMLTLPAVEVQAICDTLVVQSMSLSSLDAICQAMVAMPTNFISFTTCKYLAGCLFAKKISELDQTVSRNFLLTISQFASVYSKPLVDGCLIPYMERGKLGPHQADYMLKIAKEGLDSQSKILVLRSLLQSPHLEWNEHVSGFVQGILSCKVDVDTDLLNLLVKVLTERGNTQRNCPKFSKFLLAIINKFKARLTIDHKTLLMATVEKSDVFLKKAIISALRKSMK